LENKEKCALCKGAMSRKYLPMKQWNIEGFICGNCYSKKIFEHYPGKHVRVNIYDKK